MFALRDALVAILLTPLPVAANQEQIIFTSNDSKHVAIIGAGVAGASAAFRLNEFTGTSLFITIYERESNVGGRVSSIRVHPNGVELEEEGATNFYTDDWCLMTAVAYTGLNGMSRDAFLRRSTGVWDGNNITTAPQCNIKALSWRQIWKYGLSPWRFRRAVQSTLFNWESFARSSPFESLAKELDDAGLRGSVLSAADSYLSSLGIGRQFQLDFVQPCVRARFSRNLSDIRGLSALVAARPSEQFTVYGNARLIERLIERSQADLRLNSRVTKISRGHHRQYRLVISRNESSIEEAEFDTVILALPLQTSQIDFSDLELGATVSQTPYIETHVALFTTLKALSPELFGSASVPDDVLIAGNTSVADFLKISKSVAFHFDCDGCMPEDECDQLEYENLYRILSLYEVDDGDIVRMIGEQLREGHSLADYGISWRHRRAWPNAFLRHQNGFIDQIEIAPRLFYLGGGEDVFGSMEMSCRMGRNVAGLVYLQRA